MQKPLLHLVKVSRPRLKGRVDCCGPLCARAGVAMGGDGITSLDLWVKTCSSSGGFSASEVEICLQHNGLFCCFFFEMFFQFLLQKRRFSQAIQFGCFLQMVHPKPPKIDTPTPVPIDDSRKSKYTSTLQQAGR